MRVLLDVTPATTGQTGVARYVRQLHAGLVAAPGVDVCAFALGRGPHPAPDGTRRVGVPLRALQASWRRTGLPRAEHLAGRGDLLHTTDLVPAPTRLPVVLTVHDLAAVEHPDLHTPGQVAMQRAQLEAARTAAAVCADSPATARALLRAGVDDDRVHVVPLGATALPAPAPVPVDGPYLLAVGEVTARKDLGTLVRAFRAASLPDDVRLVLAGPPGHRAQEVLDLVGDRVVALGRVPDDVLAGLYAGAVALCSTSVAEGFGLPLVEAMAAGAPLVATDLEVSRDVAGDAALYVPVGDERAWARALERVTAEPALRRGLVDRGRVRAEEFTWTRTVARTQRAYASALARA